MSGQIIKDCIQSPQGTGTEMIKFKFVIHDCSDSYYTKGILKSKVFLEECPIMLGSETHNYVCWSVTEVELSAGVTCAQDMLFMMLVLQLLGKDGIAYLVRVG